MRCRAFPLIYQCVINTVAVAVALFVKINKIAPFQNKISTIQ